MGIRATDRNRNLFLKGFRLSDQGSNEDPTYLGFKFVFDFGVLPVNDEYGWAPSPLLRVPNYTNEGIATGLGNPFYQPQYSNFNNIAYYSAYHYLLQREGGFVAEANRTKRANALRQFQVLLQNINNNSPWFFQSIEGLDKLEKIARTGFQDEDGADNFSPQKTDGKTLKINCLESLNLRITALSNLYETAMFDADNMRWLVPRNLRQFTMFIFVTEIRNFFKNSRLSGSSTALAALDNLSNTLTTNRNPGTNIQNFPAEDGGGFSVDGFNMTRSLDNISGNPGNSFTSFVSNVFGQSGLQNDAQAFRNQQDQSGIKPVFIYECHQCEFDFSESTPLPSSIDMGSSSADSLMAKQSFKIHIGKVRMKNQYPNIRTDKKPLILADGDQQDRTSVQTQSLTFDAIASQANELITNFTSAAVNDLVNEGINQFVNPALSGLNQTLLGNIYSFNPSQIGRMVTPNGFNFNDAQNFLNGAASTGIDNIFKGNLPNPQKVGLGGPPERAYPPISPPQDVYPRVPGTDLGTPSRVYPPPTGDVYGNVPGSDLGPPDRVYPVTTGDVYDTSPGTALGPPDRVYPAPGGDVYTDVPGSDLGVPDRVYPNPVGDVYDRVPGSDLGAPDRVYPIPGGDVYDRVPGSDLGAPDRVYPIPGGDAYENVPGSDLGAPDRVYPIPGGDAYENVPGRDLGVPDRVYPSDPIGDIYSGVPGPDLGVPDRVYPITRGDVYTEDSIFGTLPREQVYTPSTLANVAGELRSRENSFTEPPKSVYEPVVFKPPQGGLGDVYPPTVGDFIIEPPLNLGNMKPPSKFNPSLGTFNPTEEIEDEQ